MRGNELKHLDYTWESKGIGAPYPHHILDVLEQANRGIQDCNDRLSRDGLGRVSYADMGRKIENLVEYIAYLNRYVADLYPQLDQLIDGPLYKGFNLVEGATHLLSLIDIEDTKQFRTDNTLGIRESYTSGSYWPMTTELEKSYIGFEDFFGTLSPTGTEYTFMNLDKVDGFADLFEADYNQIMGKGGFAEDADIDSLDEYLQTVMDMGEYVHKMDKPFLDFLSGLLDITIIKPIIEACTGFDMITGNELTDLEKGLKVVFAVVDIATLGQAVAATQALKASGKLTAKEFSKVLLKTVAIELGSNAAAYTAGYMANEMGLPVPISILLAMGAGISVSRFGGKYLFRAADGFSMEWTPTGDVPGETVKALDDLADGGRGLDEGLESVVQGVDEVIENGLKPEFDNSYLYEIRSLDRGSRPDPSEYFTDKYIEEHLGHFEDGVTKISAKEPIGQVGPPGGTFVMPKSVADKLIEEAGGDISRLELLLGFEPGALGPNPVRIDIASPEGLRIPSGNEFGANSQWFPGGYTSGGIIEAAIDPVPKGSYTVTAIN